MKYRPITDHLNAFFSESLYYKPKLFIQTELSSLLPPSSNLPETPPHCSALSIAVRSATLRFSIVTPLYCFRITGPYRVSTNHKFRATLKTNHKFWAIMKRGLGGGRKSLTRTEPPKHIDQDQTLQIMSKNYIDQAFM